MSKPTARNKQKKEQKAKARREKAKRARAKVVEEKKADREQAKDAPKHEKQPFKGGVTQASSKPASRPTSQVHRTQGK